MWADLWPVRIGVQYNSERLEILSLVFLRRAQDRMLDGRWPSSPPASLAPSAAEGFVHLEASRRKFLRCARAAFQRGAGPWDSRQRGRKVSADGTPRGRPLLDQSQWSSSRRPAVCSHLARRPAREAEEEAEAYAAQTRTAGRRGTRARNGAGHGLEQGRGWRQDCHTGAHLPRHGWGGMCTVEPVDCQPRLLTDCDHSMGDSGLAPTPPPWPAPWLSILS